MVKKPLHFDGIFPPIPTPFDRDDRIDEHAIANNLRFLNNYGLKGYVVLGSNGEAVLLKEQEKLQVLEAARALIPSDRLMIAGTGCESTGETIALSKNAAKIGADAVLVITPSYYKGRMTSEALIHHFHMVAEAAPIPVLIYNMPACTGIDLSAETVSAVAEHPNVIGIKDSSGNVMNMADIRRLTEPDFQLLAGTASVLLPALSIGALGGILALANIAPAQCLAIRRHFLNGEWDKARELHLRMCPVNTAVTRKWGVAALKSAMDMLGQYGGPVRSPLLPISAEIKSKLRAILVEAGVV
ncbi:4-hydroxy-tetrahydrodipicolinate synthase [subsurface metagenome]